VRDLGMGSGVLDAWVAVIVGTRVAVFGLWIVIGRPVGAFNHYQSVSARRTRGAICLACGLFIAVAFVLRLV
jgi:hypothetical protein